MSSDPAEVDSTERAGQLSRDLVASNKVRERGGSFLVAIPKDASRDLGIEDGDYVLFTGAEGDDGLEVRPSDQLLDRV